MQDKYEYNKLKICNVNCTDFILSLQMYGNNFLRFFKYYNDLF